MGTDAGGIGGAAAAAVALASIEAVRRGRVKFGGGQNKIVLSPKKRKLGARRVKNILRDALRRDMYTVTGKVPDQVFADDCRFINPLSDVTGLERYCTALKSVFDPEKSRVKLDNIYVAPGGREIRAVVTTEGTLQLAKTLPWLGKIKPRKVELSWTLNDDDLVEVFDEHLFDLESGKELSGLDVLYLTFFGND